MTTELEKQFFEIFEIKPTQITDTHYLELICIINRFDTNVKYIDRYEYKILKETILDDCLDFVNKLRRDAFEKLKQQIQALFKGEQWISK